ncbi:MAG: twin-arginine translocase subunit TatC [Candidatus Sericytochromatia bacterium]|nr:twin-arginine translocase subunit TatC [Candidatus Sericytochromatia bacterium]
MESQTPLTSAAEPEEGRPPLAAVTPAVAGPHASVPRRAPGEMTPVEHLEELRFRLFKAVLALLAGFLVCFGLHEQLIPILLAPVEEPLGGLGRLITTRPAEYFLATLHVAALGGLTLALPVILYQILAFVKPGLRPVEQRHVVPLAIGAAVLFALGLAFSYIVLLPIGFRFLVAFTPASITPMLTVAAVLDFCVLFLFATGVVFELPVVLVALGLAGVLTWRQLAAFRRPAILGAFILGAVLSPSPDVLSQVILAVVLLLLYEASLALMRFLRP